MLKLEEYIARRKKEDKLNELDQKVRSENLRSCVGYVFEYFNDYIPTYDLGELTVQENEMIDKYRRQLSDYDPEVGAWLLDIYTDHHAMLNRTVARAFNEDPLFLLYSTDQEFRSISYDCYSMLIKKNPFLKDQTEMLFLLIKDIHRIQSGSNPSHDSPFISEEIHTWVEETWSKNRVNLMAFAWEWANYFWDHPEIWPAGHRIKSQESWRKYEYDFKQARNLFGLDSLYTRMPKKSFIRGHKPRFEALNNVCMVA
jgi:hypothetical protein